MKNTFDLKKFLVENKLTENSRLLAEGPADNLELKNLAKQLYLGFKKMGADVELSTHLMDLNKAPSGNLDAKNVWLYVDRVGGSLTIQLVGDKAIGFEKSIKNDFSRFEFRSLPDSESWDGRTIRNITIYPGATTSEGMYTSEEEDKAHQIMSIVKEKIGFDYPIFEDIVEHAIALMDEQEGTGAIAALYAAAETWNEEFQENGDENGEDITSRMMSILDSMEESVSEADPQTPSDVKFASKATAQAKNVGTANSRIDQQSEFAGAFENWFNSLGYKPGKITKSLVRGQVDAVLSKLGFK